MTSKTTRFFYSRTNDGKYNIFGRASIRPNGSTSGCGEPGSGSVFSVGHADTEAAAQYDVACRNGRERYSLEEFARLNRQ